MSRGGSRNMCPNIACATTRRGNWSTPVAVKRFFVRGARTGIGASRMGPGGARSGCRGRSRARRGLGRAGRQTAFAGFASAGKASGLDITRRISYLPLTSSAPRKRMPALPDVSAANVCQPNRKLGRDRRTPTLNMDVEMTGKQIMRSVYTTRISETLSLLPINELSGQHDNVSEIPSVRCNGASLSCCRQLEGLGQRGHRGLTGRSSGRRANRRDNSVGCRARRR